MDTTQPVRETNISLFDREAHNRFLAPPARSVLILSSMVCLGFSVLLAIWLFAVNLM